MLQQPLTYGHVDLVPVEHSQHAVPVTVLIAHAPLPIMGAHQVVSEVEIFLEVDQHLVEDAAIRLLGRIRWGRL